MPPATPDVPPGTDPQPAPLTSAGDWPRDWPAGWQSALLVAVPAAEPAVAGHRDTLDTSARVGVPAHLTVLYPFLPPSRIDETVCGALAGLFSGVPAFGFTLDRVGWFGDEVVWLGPGEPERFSALTALAFAAFPSCPPYGGGYDEVIPHLTVGDRGGLTAMRAAAAAILPHLPIEATATEVTLMAGPPPGDPDSPPGKWRRLASFPLG
jgi:hypothetical protein